MTTPAPQFFTVHPHIRLVRGATGLAVHDLLGREVIWLKDRAVADAVEALAHGRAISDVLGSTDGVDDVVLAHIAALEELGYGFLGPVRYVLERYRPGVHRFHQRDRLLVRSGGRLTVEATDRCVYACSFCPARTRLTADACSCSVRQERVGSRVPLEIILEALPLLRQAGYEALSLMGGEPLLEIERLWPILDRANELELAAELHTTGHGVTEEVARRLAGRPVVMVFLVPGTQQEHFDAVAAPPDAAAQLVEAIRTCREMSIPVVAKVPLDAEQPEAAMSAARWVHELGAVRVVFLKYVTRPAGLGALARLSRHGTPRDFAAGAEDMLRSANAEACIDHAMHIGLDGRIAPCAGWPGALVSLLEEDIASILARNALDEMRKTSRCMQPVCEACEFRLACSACAVRTEQHIGTWAGRHWDCSYDPYLARFGMPRATCTTQVEDLGRTR